MPDLKWPLACCAAFFLIANPAGAQGIVEPFPGPTAEGWTLSTDSLDSSISWHPLNAEGTSSTGSIRIAEDFEACVGTTFYRCLESLDGELSFELEYYVPSGQTSPTAGGVEVVRFVTLLPESGCTGSQVDFTADFLDVVAEPTDTWLTTPEFSVSTAGAVSARVGVYLYICDFPPTQTSFVVHIDNVMIEGGSTVFLDGFETAGIHRWSSSTE